MNTQTVKVPMSVAEFLEKYQAVLLPVLKRMKNK